MNGIPVSPWKGFTRYLRNALNAVEGWSFVEPFFPVFNVDGMHWADDLGIAQESQNVVTATVGGPTLTVPANESWLVLCCVGQIAGVAAGQITVGQARLALRMEGVQMPITEAANGTTRIGAITVWTPPYPVMMHPGDALIGQFFNGHTADLGSTVHALRRRLPSASTP